MAELQSNIDKHLNTTDKIEFIKWIKSKGYAKKNCWCKHIDEYKNKDKKN